MMQNGGQRGKFVRIVAAALCALLLLMLVVPVLLAASGDGGGESPNFVVGTSGDDGALIGMIYEYSIAGEDDMTYTDPGGNDTLRNVTIRNTGSGTGRAIFQKSSGSYTLSGILSLQNVQMNLSGGLVLEADAVIVVHQLLDGSSIQITEIKGVLDSPREIVRGITEGEAAFFSLGASYTKYYLNGSLYASKKTASVYRVLFDGNGATLAASPYYKTVTPPAATIDELPYPPQKDGYIFLGWNTKADGKGDSFTESTAVDKDITVYAQWMVQAMPTFTEHPADREITVGEDARFSVKATGYPTPTLQWQKSDDGNGWEDIPGEASETLLLNDVSVDKDGSYYRAIANNRVVPDGIQSDAARLTVTGTPPASAPTLSADISGIAFGSFVSPVSNVAPVTISISGENLSGNIAYDITGTDGSSFDVIKGSWSDAAGGVLNIVFTPDGEKPYSAALELTSYGAEKLTIPITAAVLASGTPVLHTDRNSVNFGNVVEDTTTLADTLYLWGDNLGGDISYVLSGGDASVFSVDIGSGWTPSGGGQLRVTFSPISARAYSATLTVKSADAADIVISLTGTGISAPVAPSLSVSESAANFGNVYSGAPETIDITVTGENLASDIGIAKTGGDAGVFSYNKATGWSDAAGGTLNLTFTPTGSGAKTATVVITTYGVADKTVTLTGTGVESVAPSFISGSPQGVTKNKGEEAKFTVTVAGGTPAPTLQWQRSDDDGENWNDIDGAIGTTYTIGSVTEEDNGDLFRCIAKNAAKPLGVVSESAKLTVVYPQLTVTPVSLSFGDVYSGISATKTITVSGSHLTGAVAYEKIETGSATVFSITETSWVPATGGTLTVAFKPTAAGNYTASVKITSDGAAAQTVTLSGTGKTPSFSTHPLSQTKAVGENVEFTAVFANGGAETTPKWEKSTDGGNTWTVVSGATTWTLKIPNLMAANNGDRYRCVAAYAGETVTSNVATLTVNAASPNHIITESPGKVSEKGKTVVFKITGEVEKVTAVKVNNRPMTLEGKGTVSVKLKDGVTEVGTLTSGSVVVTLNSAYVDALADGTYPVEATFDDGITVSGSFTIARGGSGGGGVYTGDSANTALWTVLAAIGASGIILLLVLKINEKKKTTDK